MTTIASAEDMKSRVSSNLFGHGFRCPVSDSWTAIFIISIVVAGLVCVISGFLAIPFAIILPAGIFYLTIFRPARKTYLDWVRDIIIHPASEHLIATLSGFDIARLSRTRYETKAGSLTVEFLVRPYLKQINCEVRSYRPGGGIGTILEVDVRTGTNAIYRIIKSASWLENAEINRLLMEIDRGLREWAAADLEVMTDIKTDISQLGATVQ